MATACARLPPPALASSSLTADGERKATDGPQQDWSDVGGDGKHGTQAPKDSFKEDTI